MRKKREERNAKRRDPDEFRAPKVQGDETLHFYFRILPELQVGDKCATGECDVPSDLWYYENGSHWLNDTKEKLECPRLHDSEECPLCSLGFDLLDKEKDEDMRKDIAKKFLGRGGFAVNVYFLDTKSNPEDLRGKVKWFNLPLTVFKILDECITNDDAGDEVDPQPCGIFYHPYEGGYTFKLEARKKGDWNTYERSKLLVKTFGPLIDDGKGNPDEEAIEKVLAQRHILQNKFPARNAEKLAKVVAKIENQGADDEGDDAEEIPINKTEEVVNEVRSEKKAESKPKPEKADPEPEKADPEPEKADPEPEKADPEPEKADPEPAPKEEAEKDPELAELLGAIKSGKKSK
jgi:hypothetical protein